MIDSIFHRRRKKLMHYLEDGVAILKTAPYHSRNGDVLFQFRPDSDFYYLTHFPEPEAIVVLIPDRPDGEYLLFCREKNFMQEQWDGERIGLKGAVNNYGSDQSFSIGQFSKKLPELLDNRKNIYTVIGRYTDFDHLLLRSISELSHIKDKCDHTCKKLVDIRSILNEMRLIKSKYEIEIIQKAANISAAGHKRAMTRTRPGKFEYQIQGELEYAFRIGGSEWPAYPPIVAGGRNACILHYTSNRCALNDGDLVLIDAGAELDCYASDITRTFPVNGYFSGEQKALYEIIFSAQKAAIENIQPEMSVIKYHEAAVRILTEGLIELGLLCGDIDELIENNIYQKYYMHKTGHWLGMDVHDVGEYKIDGEWRKLKPGMIITVEPGLYISECPKIDTRWHNIGIRIEDEILVTRKGNENLSIHLYKSIDDIQHFMSSC